MKSGAAYYVAMLIDGAAVPSSAVFNGTAAACAMCARRLNANKAKHFSVTWGVFPCA